jgi:hypothetical protein
MAERVLASSPLEAGRVVGQSGRVLARVCAVVAVSLGLGLAVASLHDIQRLTTAVAAVGLAGAALFVGRRDLTQPHVLLPLVWFAAVAVAQVDFFNYQTPWSRETTTVVFACPLVLAAASRWAAGPMSVRTVRPRGIDPVIDARVRIASCILIVLGAAGLYLKIQILGTAPIFSDSIDTLRSAGGIKIPAYLTFLTNCFALCGWLRTYRFFAGSKATSLRAEDLALVAVALGGVAASASRNALLLTLILPLIFAYLVGAFRDRRLGTTIVLTIGTAVAVAIIAGLFFIRTSQHRDSAFESYFYRGVVPATPAVLRPTLPIQIGVAAPFETLNRVVRSTHRPGTRPAGHYSVPGLPTQLSFLTGPRANFYLLTAKLSSPYYFNVSTYAGPLYADLGLGGLLFASTVLGVLFGFSRRFLFLAGSMAAYAIAAYLAYLTAFLLYENVLTFYTFSVVWDLTILFLLGQLCIVRGRPDHRNST